MFPVIIFTDIFYATNVRNVRYIRALFLLKLKQTRGDSTWKLVQGSIKPYFMVVFITGGFRIILELWIEQDRYYNMIVFTKMIPVNQSR